VVYRQARQLAQVLDSWKLDASVLALIVSWKFGIGWLVFATPVFITAEELILRGVDVAAPR